MNTSEFLREDDRELISAASPLIGGMVLARDDMSAGTVASALRAASGRIYTGICLHASCGIGFCAEHAAVAEMLKGGGTIIGTIVAVSAQGVLSPCGRCRELMMQLHPRNAAARVVLPDDRVARLVDLLPHHWLDIA